MNLFYKLMYFCQIGINLFSMQTLMTFSRKFILKPSQLSMKFKLFIKIKCRKTKPVLLPNSQYVVFIMLFNAKMLTTKKFYSKSCLKRRKTLVLKTNSSLMKAKSIAKCSLGALCNTFDLHGAKISIDNFWSSF